MFGRIAAPAATAPATAILDEAVHAFRGRARDAAGNEAEAAHFSEVERLDPSVQRTDGPHTYTASTSATFVFTCDEADCFRACSLDGASFRQSTIPAGWTKVADESHQLAVHAIRPRGQDALVASARAGETRDCPGAVIAV
ncbi:hypothetical protein [Vulgatibacter sp.]|uniref:hypothetical protein n=1 Tax=Vulgatibacter sp. TaxID=1971226 RepID=UPI0035685A6A